MLSVRELVKVYPGPVAALQGVDLDLPNGMFGLLGPNGAGKSTLMRTVATLQQPTAGTIKFGDIDVLADPERLRRTLGYLPQDFGVYPRVSAYAMLDQLGNDLIAKYSLRAIAIHHRVGRVHIGEPSVVIAASAPHRADALDACREAIETLKSTIPLWKKEVYAGGEEWIGRGS